jgi:predicted nucleic-acid-binding Zn-ribbon protein
MDSKTCPKCGSSMNTDKTLACYTPVSLVTPDQFIGDRLETFYCSSCGYVELYRKKS